MTTKENRYKMKKGKVKITKLIVTALFAGMGFVLSTMVVFPQMAPFQHFMNVLAAVLLGPWYGLIQALLTGLMRMMTGRTILAVVGGIVGAFLSGIGYKMTEKIGAAFLGEVVGTGIISAMIAYPLMKYLFGVALPNPFYYIPFFLPSSLIGSFMGTLVLGVLQRNGLLEKMKRRLED